MLFTKFDALLPVALGKLTHTDRQLSPQGQLSKAKSFVQDIFRTADVQGRLSQMRHAPRSYVQIGGLYYSFLMHMLVPGNKLCTRHA